ncbi:glycosyltransferase family 4 protein [Arthrobacter sp. UM1]|uniref:glycosyltransferase family 4 protein n=1 Tax=Arthrobacter sp. UM1 TaxID=2766776 RepID=UPI00299EF8A4|nr:glycosyltransferase family 4 protein [Arthrobacter sp. UM1]MCB4207990.1 glycosyltransferase family 4 protein [Arthrobacter sp. UM1]
MSFVVAFNRDRDSYHAARAFAEVGQLRRFVTDYYAKAWPVQLPGLQHRSAESVPPSLVTPSLQALLRQLPYEALRRVGPVDFPSHAVEGALGRTAARVARQNPDADLFLYSGSAAQAFAGPSTGRRILFQYHPSPSFIEETMRTVDELGSARPWTPEAEVDSPAMQARHLQETSLADAVVCASGFTRQGLLASGVPAERISVVPYGCPEPLPLAPVEPTRTCRFLFVGQGVQRKGLHILLEAWRRARLPGARLRIVASRLDPQMEDFARGLTNVQITPRVSREELRRLMAEADTFVLPSLVEGFGLVLGEALSSGARLIASDNTGLADLPLDPAVKTVVRAGRVEPLVEALRQARETFEPRRAYRELCVAEAAAHSWAVFRQGVRDAAGVAS